jgi:Pretoxin HINT domain
LRGRDPREFANILIALIRDPIKYEVKPVGGPGSPGMLFVEGKRANLQRFYSPPSAPSFRLRPGDMLTTDEYGLPVIDRQGGYTTTNSGRMTADRLLADMGRGPDPRVIAELSSNPSFGDIGPFLGHLMNDANARNDGSLAAAIAQVEKQEHKAPSQFGFVITTRSRVEYQIPVGQMMLEAQKTAMFAQQQLESDVAALDAYNKAIAPRNESVRQLLATVAGKDLGLDVKAWKAWWVDQLGYILRATEESPKSTVVEDVPLSYQPQPVLVQQVVTPLYQTFARMSCFGAGTPVRTIDGTRPIESLKVGDLVLTQSTSSGALGYRPILVVHHNPPSATFRIQLKGESIISSHFHRFWVAGRGWVMARELKAGDPVRTLGGVVPVEAVEADKVQLVYNLDIAEDADFFAGQLGALVHDNTLPDPRLAPFDGGSTPALAVAKSAK